MREKKKKRKESRPKEIQRNELTVVEKRIKKERYVQGNKRAKRKKKSKKKGERNKERKNGQIKK